MIYPRYILLFVAFAGFAGAGLFADTSEQALKKAGEYRYFYRTFFKLYDAELFVSPDSKPDQVLSGNHPFELRFRYLRSVDKASIIKAADRMLKRNLTDAEWKQIADLVTQLNQHYSSVQKGDRSSLRYNPETGTTLSINGQAFPSIPGRDFARFYFRIWLGEQPLSKTMRDTLFGRQ